MATTKCSMLHFLSLFTGLLNYVHYVVDLGRDQDGDVSYMTEQCLLQCTIILMYSFSGQCGTQKLFSWGINKFYVLIRRASTFTHV